MIDLFISFFYGLFLAAFAITVVIWASGGLSKQNVGAKDFCLMLYSVSFICLYLCMQIHSNDTKIDTPPEQEVLKIENSDLQGLRCKGYNIGKDCAYICSSSSKMCLHVRYKQKQHTMCSTQTK